MDRSRGAVGAGERGGGGDEAVGRRGTDRGPRRPGWGALVAGMVGEWEPIEEIGGRWRIADEGWRRPIHRDYFRVETRSLLCEIFRDRLTKEWYLERSYD